MPSSPPVPAARYLRMSREHQNYASARQAEAIARYAAARGYRIVATDEDAGVSGLRLAGREGLKRLLADVISGWPGFEAVLVYDVSRWGRFQDTDQSAHYEFLCRQAVVRVEYCAEPFDNDGSPAAALIKRSMAAEYSRDLSARIKEAKRGLALRGFWQAARPGHGLRRVAVTPGGRRRMLLEDGERKAVAGDRVLVVRGPPGEVAVVRRIFSLYVVGGLSRREIARTLNAEGERARGGARWTSARIAGVLANEAYVGVYVYGRFAYDLGRRAPRPQEQWVRVRGALSPIVSPAMFRAAQANTRRCKGQVSDDVLAAELRSALATHGRLSASIIREHPATHCPDVYKRRFGSLEAAYAAAGHQPSRQQLAAARGARAARPWLRRERPPPPPERGPAGRPARPARARGPGERQPDQRDARHVQRRGLPAAVRRHARRLRPGELRALHTTGARMPAAARSRFGPGVSRRSRRRGADTARVCGPDQMARPSSGEAVAVQGALIVGRALRDPRATGPTPPRAGGSGCSAAQPTGQLEGGHVSVAARALDTTLW